MDGLIHPKHRSMKTSKYLWALCLLMQGMAAHAQQKKQSTADTLVRFQVAGACEMCKERIESNASMRGVKKVTWDVDNKELTLQYNPSVVTMEKVQNRIVASGHDVGDKKAKQAVYQALPDCCHYRELEKTIHGNPSAGNQPDRKVQATADSLVSRSVHPGDSAAMHLVKGVVLEDDQRGTLKPLAGASVYWLGEKEGVLADSAGVFSIRHRETNRRLVVSYAGYRSDTLTIADVNELKIVLASNNQLKEVTVISRQRATYVNNFSPIRTQTMTGAELVKAACCNLSESFETNPSVDVSYNDAVTGSKQIQLLGLSGNYTQLTVENLPGPRGIATALGLNSIAGPWIESIQLTKGVGSVANGYESIAGQINVELKKPENSEKLLANMYVNDYGKVDLNLNMAGKIGKKWSAGLLLHDNFFTNNKLDFNKDGFRDLPTGNTFSLVNRYKFDNSKGTLIQFGFKLLNDKRTGGEVGFDPQKDKYTTNKYGLGINTERYEGFLKIGYLFPEKKYKSLGLQITGIRHSEESYFGLTTYNARQQTIYSNLIYQSIIGTTIHKFRAGMSFVYDRYDEDFRLTNYRRTETVPGIFGEYTYTPGTRFSAVLGLRADHNSLFGFFLTPRLNLRYEPVHGTVIRASVGRGQRTANIFAENTSVFVSARQLNIIASGAGKAYGLDPEIAWNKGISVDQQFKLFGNQSTVSVDYFRNDFTNQVVVDLEDPRSVRFYNLDGRSYSNSFQAEWSMEPIKRLELRMAYRYFDVKTTYGGRLLERPLIAKNRAFANLAYAVGAFRFDYTVTYNGSKRLPDTRANVPAYQLQAYSPAYVLMNAQVSATVGKKNPFDLYMGVENLTNYFQDKVILAADQPFNGYFDATMIWGPVNGRMFYGGIRWKIK